MDVLHTYGVLVGYFSAVTYNMAGIIAALGVPFVMWHSGYLAGILTLLVVSLFATIPTLWVLETMARAEVRKSARHSYRSS
jgi:F420-0:gamma-glutamyl ligase-like protein